MGAHSSTMAAMKAMKAMKAKSATAMKAMKAKSASARKAMKASGKMTATAAYQSAAETTGLKTKDVKGAVEGIMEIAASELKKNGTFKIAGFLNLKLKKKPATKARKGVNPFTKEPCVFKAKPASKTVRVLAMKKFKEAVN